MGTQIQAILWAQFRTVRNYLPRTSFGAALVWILGAAWYGLVAAIAAALAASLPHLPARELPRSVAMMLLFLLLFWQVFPLMTLNSGWSLDLSRLLIYPIRERTLFAIEVLLRITSSFEALILLAGLIIGLLLHPRVPSLYPLLLLLYIPLNLFLSLAVRETVLRVFRRKKFKEIFAVFFLLIVLSPTLLANTSLGARLAPFAFRLAAGRGTPWFELSTLALGHFSVVAFCTILLWTAACYWFAVRQFANGLHQEHGGFGAHLRRKKTEQQEMASQRDLVSGWIARLFPDPAAALIEKEFRILVRSPRFRVIFGMACVFSVIIFLPFTSGRPGSHTVTQNYLPAVSTYGLVLLGEVLLWNAFGFDRQAAQIYFVAPVRFSTVLRAKNIVAIVFILLMTLLITPVGLLFRLGVTPVSILASFSLTLVLSIFFLAFGNLTSVLLPRPVDPNQAMRKQSSGQVSLWFLLTLLIVAIPVGLAFAARWAFDSDWAFFAVLAVDLVIAVVVYQVTTEAAIERAERDRERILDALGRSASPIAS